MKKKKEKKKKLPADAGDAGLTQVPWVGKIPWRRKRQLTPVFLLGKSHGPRSLVGYSPRGCRKRWTLWLRASLVARLVMNPPALQEILVQFPGREDPLEKG